MKYLYVIMFLIMVMGLASAYDDIGFYKQNENLDLNLGCSFNKTYCPNTFDCNISIYRSDTVLINNQEMTKTNHPTYNYTIDSSNLSKSGLYYGRQVCCGTIGCSDYSFSFNVNLQGKEYETVDGLVYIIMLLLILCLFVYAVYIFKTTEWIDYHGDDGTLIKINWQKYYKILGFISAYFFFVMITYFSWNISMGILQFDEMANLFKMLFRISFALIIPIFLGISIYSVARYATDKKKEELIERNLL